MEFRRVEARLSPRSLKSKALKSSGMLRNDKSSNSMHSRGMLQAKANFQISKRFRLWGESACNWRMRMAKHSVE